MIVRPGPSLSSQSNCLNYEQTLNFQDHPSVTGQQILLHLICELFQPYDSPGLGLGTDDDDSPGPPGRASGPDAVSGRTLAPDAGVALTVTVVAACYCPGPHKSRFRRVRAQCCPERPGPAWTGLQAVALKANDEYRYAELLPGMLPY